MRPNIACTRRRDGKVSAAGVASRWADELRRMEIAALAGQPEPVLEQAAALLVQEEARSVLRDGFVRAMLDANALVGWVGGLPEDAGRVWELHPMVVRREHRRRGIRRALAASFEVEAADEAG